MLVDPDIGLEVKSMRGKEEKYIKYSEVGLVYDRMGGNSVLIVFQFVPRVERRMYLSKISRRLKRVVHLPVCYISDNQVAFFILTKGARTQRLVADTTGKYGEVYGLIMGKV